MENTEKISSVLKNMGAREWQVEDKHRFYFNNEYLKNTLQFEVECSRSGNILNAKLKGEAISVKKARKIDQQLSECAMWYDLKDFAIHYTYYGTDEYLKDIKQMLLEKISNSLKTDN